MIDPHDATFSDDLAKTLAKDAEVARLRALLNSALEHLASVLDERDEALAKLDELGALE